MKTLPNKAMWDERYKAASFAYGTEPNLFFKEQLEGLTPGSILLPADGEGRNGVYAAQKGWKVTSFDLSEEGRNKATRLAAARGTEISYLTGDLEHLDFTEASFDAIGLIFAHFAAEAKSRLHEKLQGYLKPGGLVVFEAFSKEHLAYNKKDPKVGGPTEIGMLFSAEELTTYFKGYDVLLLEEREIDLEEGIYHIGKGSVIRFVARKPH